MEFTIPGGQIIDNNLDLETGAELDHVYGAAVAAENYRTAAKGFQQDLDRTILRVAVDGVWRVCDICVLEIPQPTIVVELVDRSAERETYLLLRHDINAHGEPVWRPSTKLLVLPWPSPPQWGNSQAVPQQRYGCVLMFAGLANINNWFEPALPML